MDETEFIKSLQKRAKEQHQLFEGMPFPSLFRLTTYWLSDHPWRIIIPVAFFVTLLARNILGQQFTEIVLKVFYRL
ncbi:MAG TPA: hypothetical protein VG935_01955 [Patescibacteria group bacterium]|nr:hypothetical protein [Patescibacteria group bacterium]